MQIPNLKEYFDELASNEVQIEGADGRIDRKFETHFIYLSTKKLYQISMGGVISRI